MVLRSPLKMGNGGKAVLKTGFGGVILGDNGASVLLGTKENPPR
jgi:hypothetical protein